MAMKSDLMTFLLSKSQITDYVGSRIHFGQAPQDETFPYMTISRLSNPMHPHMTSESKMSSPTFQIDIWSELSLQAEDIEEAFRNAIDGKRGFSMGSTNVRVSYIENMFDDNEFMDDGKDSHDGIYRVQITIIIWHNRSIPTLL